MIKPDSPKSPQAVDHDRLQEARGRIRLAINRLTGKYPFHARVIERFVIEPATNISTMAVTVRGSDVVLLFDSKFVLGIRLDELVGVCLHEVHHVAFGHLLNDPADFPDRWAKTVAEEITVNEFVTEPLPGSPILLSQFPNLPPMESMRQRYDRLRLIRQPDRQGVLSASGSSLTESVTPGGPSAVGVVDDHEAWSNTLIDPLGAEATVQALLHDAATDVGSDKVPGYLRGRLAAIGVGRIDGHGRYDLTGNGGGILPWSQLLRRYVGEMQHSRPDLRRPSRRLPELVGAVPGRRRQAGRLRVMAVIDTSGSITPALLEMICAELSRLAASYDVIVVECDTKIHDVYPYRQLEEVYGRGGTDLRPPFQPDFLRQHRPDLLIYFTDGFGPAPSKPPPLPVIWCLTHDGKPPVVWGRIVRMAPQQT